MVVKGGKTGGMVELDRVVDDPVWLMPVPGGFVGPASGGFDV